MKIKNIQKTTVQISKDISLENKKASTYGSISFRRQLTTLSNENYEQYIKDMIGKINSQGEVVAKKANLAEFQKYRELIAKLLNETASNSYELCKENKFDARGRHKAFALVKKVNQKLDEMASAILSEQSTNIQMMSMVDDIRGMLVDLYL